MESPKFAVCQYCGKEFAHGRTPTYIARRRYCSSSCHAKAETKGVLRKPRKALICEYCGKSFGEDQPFSQIKNRRYCSRACAHHLVKVACLICGTMFAPIKGKRYCSTTCAGIARRGVAVTPGRYPDDILEKIRELYPDCGADETARILEIDRDYVQGYANRHKIPLSDDARKRLKGLPSKDRMLNNNPMRNESSKRKVQEWREAHPEKQAEIMLALNRGNQRLQRDNPSGLEYKLRAILDEFGVNYEPSAMIKDKLIVDIKIDRLIIQADGDYWHGHARFNPLSQRQTDQQKRDKAQDKYLTKCGYVVVRIWESDMSKDYVEGILKEHNLI